MSANVICQSLLNLQPHDTGHMMTITHGIGWLLILSKSFSVKCAQRSKLRFILMRPIQTERIKRSEAAREKVSDWNKKDIKSIECTVRSCGNLRKLRKQGKKHTFVVNLLATLHMEKGRHNGLKNFSFRPCEFSD